MEQYKKTTTYKIIKEQKMLFNDPNEMVNFVKFCEYMLFSEQTEELPIPNEDVKEYFRDAYKFVESVYTENIMKALDEGLRCEKLKKE
jgi:hypothetical protein